MIYGQTTKQSKNAKTINEELLKEKEKNFNKLVENNINLVHYLIHQNFYSINPKESEDIIQEGILGLIIGINRFDPQKGTSLSTYVSYWILKNIREYLKKYELHYTNLDKIPYVDYMTIKELEAVERKLILYKALSVLTERERKIIIYRYGLFSNVPLTLKELSERLNLSKSRISVLEKKALKKMRQYLIPVCNGKNSSK